MTQGTGKPSTTNYLPYILIAAGVFILIGNLGPGRDGLFGLIGSLLGLWPIALIAVGVDLLTAGRYRTIVIGAAVVIALVFLFVPGAGGGLSAAGDAEDVRIPLEGAAAVEVSIDMGLADLTLGSTAAMSDAVSGVVNPARGERFDQDSSRRGSTLEVELRSRNARGPFNVGFISSFGGGEWNLDLTERVPVELEIDGGVGSARLDLRNVRLAGFELDAGVGSIDATLPGGNFEGSIDGGVGNITIRLPRGTPARVAIDSGIGGVNVDGSFERSGDVYTTANYAGSGIRLSVNVGVGSVRIETVP